MRSLIRAFSSRLNILWMLSYWLNIIRSLRAGCIGSSEATLVKIPHCWKSHVTAQMEALNTRYNTSMIHSLSYFWCNFCRHSGSTFPRFSRWANDAEICNAFRVCKWCKNTASSGVELIKLCSCSIQTSMKFILPKHSLGSSLTLFFPILFFRFSVKNDRKYWPKNIDDWTQVVSYKRKYVHKLLVNRLLKPAQEKVWLSELTVPQWP